MDRDPNKPAAFTAKDARKLIDAGRRVQNTPPPPPPARRQPAPPDGLHQMAVLSDDLIKSTSVEATIWSYQPRHTPRWRTTGQTITVHGIMLDEDLLLEAGSFVYVVFMGSVWVVINSRECPIDD